MASGILSCRKALASSNCSRSSLGFGHELAINAAHALALDLVNRSVVRGQPLTEAKTFLRETMPRAVRELGPHHTMTLKFQWVYAFTLHAGIGDHTLDDLLEAEAKYAEIEKVFARRFGRDHPESVALRGEFDDLKEKLAACRLRAQLASTQQRPREDSS